MDESNIPQPPVMNPQGWPAQQPGYGQQQPGYQQMPYGIPQVRPQMSFFDAIKTVLIDKYCCFTGRARRSEFWYWMLAYTILSVVLGVLSAGWLVAHVERVDFGDPLSVYKSPGYIISAVATLALLLPNLGVTVRRLHDTGRSGWWIVVPIVLYIPLMIAAMMIVNNGNNFMGLMAVFSLFYLALFVYAIIVLVWLCQDSQPRPNKYGPSPKYN